MSTQADRNDPGREPDLHDTDVAIIGMACRFPDADDVETYWRNLVAGRSSIVQFADEDLDASPRAATSAGRLVKAGAVLRDIESFDAAFFGYSGREAETIDPQQRLLLECVWEAFEDAGYPALDDHGPVGVYAGTGINTYLINNVHPARGHARNRTFLESMADMQLMFGNEKDFVTTRVSYKLGLRGPSVNVQAACSTSLVALHLACQALLAGECDLTVAGCSTVRVPQRTAYVYEPDLVFSPDGHTRSFDARAQGTTFGSGVGVVLLKPARRAHADGDAIRAVIKGTAINNDGARKAGFTAVSVAGQADVVRDALRVAGVSAETIGYVEAHGTGTAMGDPVEVAALTRAFATERRQFCALGTVKSNIGHLSWSAGMAGLIKAVLALEHRRIPASLHFERPNPQIDFARSPFYVNSSAVDWPASATPRRAGVSAFGLGGTNAHAILQEAPTRAASASGPAGAYLLPLSGKTAGAVQALARRYLEAFAGASAPALADACYTAAVGRNHFAYRAALIASSIEQLREGLSEIAEKGTGIVCARMPPRPVAFLFTGQGAQYAGMGRRLYDTVPVFRDTIDECSRALAPMWPVSLLDVLYPPSDAPARIDDIRYTQAAMFALECALARTWIAWGVEPSFVMGHSTGEYAAAHIAGVFSLEDGVRLSAQRGRLFADLVPATGKMATVVATEAQVRPVVAALASQVAIAAINGPLSTVIAGTDVAVDEACARLAEAGYQTRPLRVERAGHAPLIEPLLAPLTRLFERVALTPPSRVLISNVTGNIAGPEIATAAYWASHTRDTVRFADGTARLAREGAGVLLELGPDPVLVGLAAYSLHGQDITFVPCLRRPAAAAPSDDGRVMAAALRKLYLEGVAITWPEVYRGQTRRRVHLPTYPFQRARYWIEPPVADVADVANVADVAPDRPAHAEWLLEIAWAPAAAPPARSLAGAGRWIVVEDAGGLGAAIEATLRAAGAESERVPAHNGLAIRQALGASACPVAGVIYAVGLDRAPADDGAPDMLDQVWSTCAGLLEVTQALIAEDRPPPQLSVITRGAQAVVAGDHVDGFVSAPLWAMARVIGMEHPELRCRRVDLDGQGPELARHVVAELADDAAHDAVAFRAGQRFTATLRHHVATAFEPPSLGSDGTYVVTGGLGGVGLLIARWLAERGARRLVLVGRSPATPEAAAEFAALEDAGVEVVQVRADISARGDVERVLAVANQPAWPLRGIIHSAGVLDDGVVRQQDRNRFLKVLSPKVAGAWHLHVLTASTPTLELFVMMSSAASLIGNPGQLNHAAANAFLDALAHHRRALGLPATSLNWGAWSQAGALIRHGAVRSRLERLGFEPIPSADGVAALGYAVACGLTQLGVAPMRWARFIRECNLATSGFFAKLAGEAAATELPAPDAVVARLATAAPADRSDLLLAHVRDQAAHVLGHAPGDGPLAIDRKLAEYGLDSLSSIELRNRLQANFGIALPTMFVFDNPTIARIVDQLVKLPVAAAVATPASAATRAPAKPRRSLSMQQRRWLSLIRGGYGQRVVPIVIYAPLLAGVLRAALVHVVERHELLRYVFPDGQIEVWPAERVIPPVADLVVDVRGETTAGRAAALAACVRRCWAEMPDPAQRPSWSIRALAYPDKMVLLLSLQHLDFDGTSLTTFVQDLRAAYRSGVATGHAAIEDAPATPYAEYVEWQHAYMAGPIAEDRAFFIGLYAALQRTTTLPGHAGFARTSALESARHTPAIVTGLWARIQARAGQLGVTPFSILLAGYAAMIAHVLRASEVVIAMITNGRADPRFRATIGPFTAPFPVKVAVAGNGPEDLVHQCSRIVAAIHSRSAYPVADLTEHVPAFKDFPIDSYFTDVGINFTNYRREDDRQEPVVRVVEVLGPIHEPELAAANTEELRRIPGLHLVMDLVGDELRCNFWYHLHRFTVAQVHGWAEQFLGQLAELVGSGVH